MEPTQCSETSALITQAPGKYPEDNSSVRSLSGDMWAEIKHESYHASTDDFLYVFVDILSVLKAISQSIISLCLLYARTVEPNT
jgi:hypothetical protein